MQYYCASKSLPRLYKFTSISNLIFDITTQHGFKQVKQQMYEMVNLLMGNVVGIASDLMLLEFCKLTWL